jgi:hypothetical protein
MTWQVSILMPWLSHDLPNLLMLSASLVTILKLWTGSLWLRLSLDHWLLALLKRFDSMNNLERSW